jgi:phenylacetate-coenzyme A ligase PaaK-like adenylate-forming protein
MDFISTFKKSLQTATSKDFEQLALALFLFQASNNPVYKLYLTHLGINPTKVKSILEIPFMPIEFFKTHKILTFATSLDTDNNHICIGRQQETKFESSGTTGQIPSCHYVLDTNFYLQNAEHIFTSFYGNLENYHFLALLPSYLERQTSSLVYMVQGFMHKTSSFSGFYLNNLEELHQTIQKLKHSDKKILLIGVTFALLDFADFIEKHDLDLSDIIVMETGGMKGRRAEMTREEVHEILTKAFGCAKIHSEYGMTELLSQGYSQGDGIFDLPPTMRVFLRNITDPFELNGNYRDGGINVIDLANVESCAFIETKDIGVFSNNDKISFKILGRYDNADVRGCNLMVF